MNKKIKNPIFWLGIVSVILLAADIDPESLESWSKLYEEFMTIIKNPYILGMVVIAAYSQFNDNGIKGLDVPFKKIK